jgi:hypothetical protein
MVSFDMIQICTGTITKKVKSTGKRRKGKKGEELGLNHFFFKFDFV